MCINANLSIGSFIVGTIINVILLKANPSTDYYVIALIYQFILCMQLFDYIAWKDSMCGKLNEVATKAGFLQNMLQPVVIILLLLFFTKNQSKIAKGVVNLLLILYISYIFYQLYYNKSPKAITCLKPTAKCKHLQYDWWSNIGNYAILVFLIPIVASFLLLLQSKKVAIIHSSYVVISFLLSHFFYACGLPSMFCLFATGGPILNLILMKMV